MKISDNKLGKLLTSSLDWDQADKCLSSMQLSRYIDGKSDQQESEWIENHLDNCESCYADFVEVRRVQLNLRQAAQNAAESETLVENDFLGIFANRLFNAMQILTKPGLKKFLIPAPLGMIALLAIFIGFKEFGGPDSKQYRSSQTFSKMIAVLTTEKNIQHNESGSVIGLPSGEKMTNAFMEGTSLEIAAFRLGVFLTEVELILHSQKLKQESKKEIRQGDQLAKILELLNQSSGDLGELEKALTKENSFDSIQDKEKQIREKLKPQNVAFYLELGEWSACGQVAVQGKNKDFFQIETISFFRNQAIERKLPKGVIRALENILSISQQGISNQKDFQSILHNLNEIMELMLQFA